MYFTFPYFSVRGVEFNFFKNIIRAGLTGQYLNIHKQIILHDSMVGSNAFSARAYHTWSACSRARRVRQCGKLPIRENLVITWPYTDRPTAWEFVRNTGIPVENNWINRYGNRNATQGFIWKEIAWPAGLFKRKNNDKVVFFSTLFLMFILTWITEKERVIENKTDEFCRKKNMKIQSGGETMRNASGQQGENERQWKIKANMNTGDKILGKHIRQFLHNNNM